jgi:hypothetical protein
MATAPILPLTAPVPGDFSFVKDKETRIMFDDAYQAITKAEAWDYMKTDPGDGGYMFTQSDMLAKINTKMTYDGHSGASYGWTMRTMQHLARTGWEAFVKEYSAARMV